jgi:hypothetical protein
LREVKEVKEKGGMMNLAKKEAASKNQKGKKG